MKDEEIYKKAMDKWGRELQIIMGIEEMAELTKALVKHLRGKGNSDDILEEMADVDIMLGQLKRMFNVFDRFNKIRRVKMDRLEIMLNTSNQKDTNEVSKSG